MANEPVDQFDPDMQKLTAEPWFSRAVDLIVEASDILAINGVVKGTVFGGMGRLSMDDPFAGALASLETIPRTEMAFVVVRVPDNDGLLDASRAVKAMRDRVRDANPDASLMVLPADWSFRTMQPETARSFATNMLAFVSDAELEKIGLFRKELP